MFKIQTEKGWIEVESLEDLITFATKDYQGIIPQNSIVEMFVDGIWRYWGRARKLLNTYWGNTTRLEQGVREDKGVLVKMYKNTPVYWIETRYGREIKIQDGHFVDKFTAKELI